MVFEPQPEDQGSTPSVWTDSQSLPFELLADPKKIKLFAEDYPIATLLKALTQALKINWYQTESLDALGNISLKIDAIDFDALLPILFDQATQSQASTDQPPKIYGYRKQGDTYFFGSLDKLSARTIEKITLKHRSVEILGDPFREPQDFSNLSNTPINTGNTSNFNTPIRSGRVVPLSGIILIIIPHLPLTHNPFLRVVRNPNSRL